MDNPVPYVDVIPGFLFFFSINANPDACDNSIQAVSEFLNLKYSLKILFPIAFTVSCLTAFPAQFFFKKSMEPSPPSEIGISSILWVRVYFIYSICN